jgi:hypothetical protein
MAHRIEGRIIHLNHRYGRERIRLDGRHAASI